MEDMMNDEQPVVAKSNESPGSEGKEKENIDDFLFKKSSFFFISI